MQGVGAASVVVLGGFFLSAPGCALADAATEGNSRALYGARRDVDLPGATAIAIGDADGDGRDEVLVANDSPHLLAIGDGDADVLFDLPLQLSDLQSADLDGDGRLDLVGTGDGQIVVVLDAPSADRSISMLHTKAFVPLSDAEVAVGDLNVDDYPDLAVNGGAGEIAVFFQDPAEPGHFADDPRFLELDTSWLSSKFAIADENGDGANDDVVVEESLDGRVAVMRQDDPGSFDAPATLEASRDDLNQPQAVLAADLDAAGRVDLAASFMGHLSVYSSARGPIELVDTLEGQFGAYVGAGDATGDGLLELVATQSTPYQPVVDELLVFEQTADLRFAATQTLRLPDMSADLAIGDVNGDGLADVAALTVSNVSIFHAGVDRDES